jgi:hypothetical protein
MIRSALLKTAVLSLAFAPALLSGQLQIAFEGFAGMESAGKAATLYSGRLPEGIWMIETLVQDGEVQSLGGMNDDATVIDNALVLEANGHSYGLNHRYDGFDIYGGSPYTNQFVSGLIEISVWEAHDSSATAAAAGFITLTRMNPVLEIRESGSAVELSWPAGASRLKLQYTECLQFPWTSVNEPPSVIGDKCVCIRTCNQQTCFYRLYLP